MKFVITYNLNIHSYKYIITMSSSILNVKNNYIILTNNIVTTITAGSLLYIKEKVMDLSSNRTDISWQNILKDSNANYKNRIILSGKLTIGNTTSTSCLITQNNIKNNMKFIFDSSNNKCGKILFVKNLDASDNSYNYLFANLRNTSFLKDNSYNINNPSSPPISDVSYVRYIRHLNYYLSDSDMYKININDYLYKYRKYSYINPSDTFNSNFSYSDINYAITSISNDYYFINTTIDSSSSINFKSSNFTRLLIDNNSLEVNDFTILQKNFPYSSTRNILSYNKLTLDFKHINYYDFSLSTAVDGLPFYTSILNNNMNTIQTFLIKTNNFQIIQNIKNTSKIVFGLKNVHLYNIKVLDYSSNLYTKSITFNNQPNKILKRDFSNIMFLGLGNCLTGITQHDIYNHTHFSTNSNNKSIITFKKNINTHNINTKSNFTSLIPNLNKYYLLDICLNYIKNKNINSYNINSNNINNTINYSNVLYNNVATQSSKVFNLNLKKLFHASTNNNFKNIFENLATLNNIDNNIYSEYYDEINAETYIKFSNIITDSNDIGIRNIDTLLGTYGNMISINSDEGYDLKFNYSRNFYLYNILDIYFSYSSLGLTNNYDFDFGILNFYSLQTANYIETSSTSDFTNIDCVFIYHDPERDPNPNYRYPNNNIEITRLADIDSLTSAIATYRGQGSTTGTTNIAFIPAQNGSNLSRKMIQGLVGLNNIPKLLSIEPYDSNFINGRGFINQYQISDSCITKNCDKVAVKQNAIKHESVKNNRIYSSNSLKKQNFANIVKSNTRNKLSQECVINNITTTTRNVITINNVINDPNCANSIKTRTPFMMFRKGKYL